MTPGQEIVLDDALRQLRLPAMGREWREYARQAKDAGEGYVGFLLALANCELEQRQANQIQRRLREARFPLLKTLETTDLNKWPVLDAVQVRDYAECGYITRRENVVLLGKHGTGKTHAATVLGVEACRKGYRVGFTTAAALVNTLIESREERGLNRRLVRLSRFELLIVDEVGYIPFSVRLASPCTAKPAYFTYPLRWRWGSDLARVPRPLSAHPRRRPRSSICRSFPCRAHDARNMPPPRSGPR